MIGETSVVFDTTYILPLYGIRVESVKNINKDIIRLFEEETPNIEIFFPSTCLLEAMYNVIKENKVKKDPSFIQRYIKATQFIVRNPKITIIDPLISSEINSIALKLSFTGHQDTLDCLIAGCALSFDSILVTEDTPLKKKIAELPSFEDQITLTWNQFRKKFL